MPNVEVPRERRAHGDAMFPLGVYYVTLTPGPRQEFVAHHWHEEAEFVLAAVGAVNVQVGTQVHRLSCGQGVFIHGGEVHTMTPPDEGPSEWYAVVFHSDLLSSARYDSIQHQYMSPLEERRMQLPTLYVGDHAWDTAFLDHMRQVIQLFEAKHSGYQLAIKGHLCLAIAGLDEQQRISYEQRATPVDEQNLLRLKTVLTYIESHAAEKIRLSELADLFSMSEGHFCRYFKQMTNKRPVEYINDRRINHAANLLVKTDKSVMDIAFEVGFDNFSYFDKVFRTVKHCTPYQYRQLMLGTADRVVFEHYHATVEV